MTESVSYKMSCITFLSNRRSRKRVFLKINQQKSEKFLKISEQFTIDLCNKFNVNNIRIMGVTEGQKEDTFMKNNSQRYYFRDEPRAEKYACTHMLDAQRVLAKRVPPRYPKAILVTMVKTIGRDIMLKIAGAKGRLYTKKQT